MIKQLPLCIAICGQKGAFVIVAAADSRLILLHYRKKLLAIIIQQLHLVVVCRYMAPCFTLFRTNSASCTQVGVLSFWEVDT